MKKIGIIVQYSVLLCTLTILSGCASLGDVFSIEKVKPWQRGVLAQEDMQLIPDEMESFSDDHIYFSKEAATGGKGVGGGGCGCN